MISQSCLDEQRVVLSLLDMTLLSSNLARQPLAPQPSQIDAFPGADLVWSVEPSEPHMTAAELGLHDLRRPEGTLYVSSLAMRPSLEAQAYMPPQDPWHGLPQVWSNHVQV